MELSGQRGAPDRCGVRRVPRRGSYPDAGALNMVTAGCRCPVGAGEVSRVRTSPVGRGASCGPHLLKYISCREGFVNRIRAGLRDTPCAIGHMGSNQRDLVKG